MSKASKKMLRQQRLITQIKQSNGRGVWLNAEQLAAIENNIEKRDLFVNLTEKSLSFL